MSKRSTRAHARAARAAAATRCALALAAVLCFAHALATRARAQAGAPASVSGRVRDGERGAAGISVVLLSNDPATRFRQAARAKTDAEGRYLLSNVAPGRYQIMPVTPVHVVQGLTFESWPPGRPLTLMAGESVTDVDFSVERGGVITGRVTDADGNPVIAEPIYIDPADEKTPPPSRGPFEQRDRMTDDRGVYRVYGLAPGRYRVSVGTGGETGAVSYGRRRLFERTFYPGVTEQAQARAVEVKSGDEAADVDISIGRPLKTYRASGRFVIAETGQPASGVNFAYGAADRRGGTFGAFGGMVTNERGEFITEGLTPGHYMVFAAPSSRESSEFYSDAVGFEVTNADVTGLVVPLKRGASVSGVVTVEGVADRALVARLLSRVRVYGWVEGGDGTAPPGGSRPGPLGPDGSFRLTGLRPGRLRIFYNDNEAGKSLTMLRVELNGVPVGGEGIRVAEGAQITGARVRLTYGSGVIRGQTVFLNGTPPTGVRIIASAHAAGAEAGAAGGGEGTNIWRRVETDVRGFFRLEGLPAGEYEVFVNILGAGREVVSDRQRVAVVDGAEVVVSPTIDLSKLTPPKVVAPPDQ